MTTIQSDFSGVMNTMIGANGITNDEWHSYYNENKQNISKCLTSFKKQDFGFCKLDDFEKMISSQRKYYNEVNGKFDNIVVLGIGGSSLGPLAIFKALAHPFHNIIKNPRLFFLDNVDPRTIHRIKDVIDYKRTLFVVISKSGGTIETAAEFMHFYDDSIKDHFVVITDPVDGCLRDMVTKKGLTSFEIPKNLGGRYSVLSPVGIFPLLFSGINVDQLIRGAKNAHHAITHVDGFDNMVVKLSTLLTYFYTKRHIPMIGFMPYADCLDGMMEWFQQLWAESLGKKVDHGNVGSTPLRAIGTKDQHSQLQSYVEGPLDKVIGFISIGDYGTDEPIWDHNTPLLPPFTFLCHKRFSELMTAEKDATRFALAKNGRPHFDLHMASITEESIGELIYLLECVTVMAGHLLNVNPFDQPGVELGKKYTKALMGDVSMMDYKREMDSLTKGSK